MTATLELAGVFDQAVSRVTRQPHPYRTSHQIEDVSVELADGSRLELVLKDLRRAKLHRRARIAKPAFLHEEGREMVAYEILAGAGLGTPTCYLAGGDALLLEKVAGIPLWQIGDVEEWAKVARWLARMHEQFRGGCGAGGGLVRYDGGYFETWLKRARGNHRLPPSIASAHERAVALLEAAEVTLVHGELYPANVLIAGERVAVVDWETAGIGPGALDAAALVTGWQEPGRSRILEAYGDLDPSLLEAARLELALRWLGLSREWTPPPEHARDWLAEARSAAERLAA